MSQLAWVRRHLADIESDMSALHRVDDIRPMKPTRFFALAWRLPYYAGVMQARAMAARQDDAPPGRQPARAVAPRTPQPGRREVPATRTALQSDPAFKAGGVSIFSFGTAAKS
jgi:hypothetical protein